MGRPCFNPLDKRFTVIGEKIFQRTGSECLKVAIARFGVNSAEHIEYDVPTKLRMIVWEIPVEGGVAELARSNCRRFGPRPGSNPFICKVVDASLIHDAA